MPRQRIALIAAMLSALSAPLHRGAFAQHSAGSSVSDAAVYAAVLRHSGGRSSEPQQLLDSTSTRDVSGSRTTPPKVGTFWDAIPKDVQLRFDSLNRSAQSLRGLALPPTVHLLSRAAWRTELERLARARIIDLGSVAVVSRIAYTADGNAALVEMAWPCDGACGEAKYYWLRRAASGAWEVQAETVAWAG